MNVSKFELANLMVRELPLTEVEAVKIVTFIDSGGVNKLIRCLDNDDFELVGDFKHNFTVEDLQKKLGMARFAKYVGRLAEIGIRVKL